MWIKFSILNLECNNETIFLKQYISNLPEIRENILKTNEEIQEFINSTEPVITFIRLISKNREFLKV